MSPRARHTRYELERQQRSERARSHYARVKQRKATRALRRAVLSGAFLAAFGAGFFAGNGHSEAWFASFGAPEQTVERISVLGVERVAAFEIAERSGIERSADIGKVDLDAAGERIAAHPWLRSARVRRLPDGGVLAIVDEREVIAALRTAAGDDAWHAVDRDGTAFASVDPAQHPELLRLRSDEASAQPEDVATAIDLARRVERAGVARPASIVLPSRTADESAVALGWRLHLTDGGPEVVFGREPSHERIARLAELLDARLDLVRSAERIDLRFRDRAILRAADATTATEDGDAATTKDNGASDSARETSLGERPASA